MIKEITEDAWQALNIPELKSLFYSPEFLKSIEKAFECKLHYLIYINSGNVLAATALFSKGKNIVTPIAFTYSNIFFDTALSERRYLQVLEDLISFLKRNWVGINLRIPSAIKDLRPFIWSNFAIQNRYTYIKDPGTAIDKSVFKKYKRAIDEGLSFKCEKACELAINRNLDYFKSYGLVYSEFLNYKMLFQNLSEKDYLRSFNIYKSNQLICSNLVLIDAYQKRLFTLLLHASDEKLAHPFLYVSGLEWTAGQGINSIDFCGANVKAIATFKSFFNPILEPYYVVSYHPLQNLKQLFKVGISFFRRKPQK